MAAPPARLELALAPTPILKLDRLSRRLGVELHVKRDDLTGLLESGNKVRKLEFLVGEALQQGADTLVTCGALQSNGCRAVAAVAARLGLRAVLLVRGEPPAAYDGNLLLDRLLGAADADLAVLVELAREEGLLLEPVYTARGFRGLLETLARDPKALGQRICFIHTGGLFSLCPFRDRLSRLLAQGEPSKG